ncbi:hypothetical protein A3A38_03700 [Candidatus Kaiserbacteria bacterium RIFCSPLOWO2_01_FULL_53_17]|uniref:Uncharacterized protein n=1 Tax=Candidatus Kaiserbacteria bacterium RIFCSPLOWO2_01_FULL_53_17 TaxID=1798511 RepID=A0A1F6EGG1_9BACT|nr:MAG: hypothetical protein A3A38_03700 [Candidatus Kaiserbacteria bacterium RIFCSPLOWO2_01_FULL_53_17]
MEEKYLPRQKGGRWAISREIGGRWLALIQDTPVDDPADAALVLWELGIELRLKNIRRYFPARRKGRCPTLELLELFAKLGSEKKEKCGV